MAAPQLGGHDPDETERENERENDPETDSAVD
jgi:hypothetical protein